MYSVRFENVKNTKKIQNSQEGRLRCSKKLRPAPFRKRRHRNFEKPHTPCASVGHVLRPAFPGGFHAPSGKAASGTAELTGKRLFPEKSRGCLRPHAAPRIHLRPSFRRAKPRPAGTAAARTGKNDAHRSSSPNRRDRPRAAENGRIPSARPRTPPAGGNGRLNGNRPAGTKPTGRLPPPESPLSGLRSTSVPRVRYR